MDAIKKKMEKLSNETSEAEVRLNPCWGNVSFFITLPTLRTCFSVSFFQIRIAHFEDIKAANELEAEKYEEQLRNIQKKMQVIIIIISTTIIIIIISIIINNIINSNSTIINHHQFIIITINVFKITLMQAMESAYDVCIEDLFNQV